MENYNDSATDRIARDVTRYGEMKWDALKLDLVENLSVVFSNAFGVVIFIVLGGMGLLFFTGVATWLLGLLIGSLLWSSVIMGSLFLIIAIVVLALRQKIFADMMVGMFARMFFPEKTPDNEQ